MVDSNNPPSGGTAELIENSEADVDQELEDKVGAAIADSLDEEEQPAEQQAKPAESETAPEESNEEAEEKEPEAEAEEDPKQDEDKPPATVKLKDGSEVPLDELVNGYYRQSDYTRKTQDLAKERKAFEESRDAATQRLLQADQVSRRLAELADSLVKARQPKAPDPALLQTDPVGFLQQKEAYERAQAEISQFGQALTEHKRREEERQATQKAERVERERQLLHEKLPPAAIQAFTKDIQDIAEKAYGFTLEEIGQVEDHRYMLVLKDALEMRKIRNQKMETVRQGKNAAPPMKPAARQAPNARVNGAVKANWDRLRQENSEEAAMAVLDDSLFT
jgi:hypothetical protein